MNYGFCIPDNKYDAVEVHIHRAGVVDADVKM